MYIIHARTQKLGFKVQIPESAVAQLIFFWHGFTKLFFGNNYATNKNYVYVCAYVKGFAYVKFFNSSELPTFELTNSWNGRHNFS